MGNRNDRQTIDQWDQSGFQQATGLPYDQLQQIQQEFFRASGRDGQLSMAEFANVYSRFPGARNEPNLQQQIPRIFQTFDRDNSGTLSFDEFLSAVTMLNHSVPRQDRINYVIQQNNRQGRQFGDGRITSEYGHQVIRRLNDYYGLPAGNEHQIWQQIDQQRRGYVSQDQFMNYVRQSQGYNRRYQ